VLTDGVAATARGHPPGFESLAETAAGELRSWRERITALTATDPVLSDALAQGVEDIGALRMVDPGGVSGGAVVAAGAPWFMALFGRDSLITSWMTMVLDPTLASETLATLAEYQGQRVDVATEEQPGRILHEMRWGLTHADVEAVGDIYYGTVDATPLFVMILGELARWGGDPAQVQRLLPAADRALGWIEKYGDIDGDGFVEYRRSSPEGLVNQGWKDSWDGINFADGHLPKAPIALCEVQGYAYAAYRARAGLALQFGDAATAAQCQHKAETLKDAFNQVFWLPEKGYFAVGLDAEKKPIDALTSNLGHCLWTGIIDSDKVAPVVNHLLSSTMFSGWGLRTLSTEMGAYNPVSYHNGSVWPHDTAIAVAGLVRYGQRDAARSLLRGLVDASACFDGRLPELFCGFAREEFRTPVAYPSSCSPQAWASAVPFSLVTSLLGLTPDVPGHRLQLRPMLSPDDGGLGLAGLSLGRARVQIDSDSEHTSVRDLAGIVLDALEP
jgi:glycogen debranching enzyme